MEKKAYHVKSTKEPASQDTDSKLIILNEEKRIGEGVLEYHTREYYRLSQRLDYVSQPGSLLTILEQ